MSHLRVICPFAFGNRDFPTLLGNPEVRGSFKDKIPEWRSIDA